MTSDETRSRWRHPSMHARQGPVNGIEPVGDDVDGDALPDEHGDDVTSVRDYLGLYRRADP